MYKNYPDEVMEKIIENIDILDYISQFVELEKHGKDWFGVCPFHNETDASFSVNPDKKIFYCFGCGKGGSVISFTMQLKNWDFPTTIEYLVQQIGLDISIIKKEFSNMKLLKTFSKQNKKCQVIKREILNPNILENYRKSTILEWVNEGIEQKIMDNYGVRYDDRSKRIIYPVHNNSGDLINIKGRTLYENFKELNIKKYIYYYPLGVLDFMCGFSTKYQQFKDSNEIILFEGIKSVMKLETWGIKTAVSLETNRISEFQIKSILSLHSNIVIAMDKGVDIKQIKQDFKPLFRFSNVFLIYDTEGLLKDKDAPCDEGLEVWNRLYENKIKL